MAKAGDIIDNPITGERMIFLRTSNETEGQLLQIDMSVRPGGFAAQEHVHPLQQERFLIKTGKITLRIDGHEQRCTAGDEVTIPAGTPHVWWNSGKEELRVVLEFRPAGRFDRFITSCFALAHAGRTNARGLPRNLLQFAVMFRDYCDVIYGARPRGLPCRKWSLQCWTRSVGFSATGLMCHIPFQQIKMSREHV